MLTSCSPVGRWLDLLVLASPVMAAKKTNADASRARLTPVAVKLSMLSRLPIGWCAAGDARKDALSLITAAQMLKQAGSTAAEFSGQGGRGQGTSQELLSVDAISWPRQDLRLRQSCPGRCRGRRCVDGARGAWGFKTSLLGGQRASRDVQHPCVSRAASRRGSLVSGDGDLT